MWFCAVLSCWLAVLSLVMFVKIWCLLCCAVSFNLWLVTSCSNRMMQYCDVIRHAFTPMNTIMFLHSQNSRDNMSAILVTLPGAPSPSEESIAEVSLQVHKPLLPFLLPIHAYMFLIFWNYCCSVLQMQWSLVYSTTSVPHRMCRINQVLDKSG